MRSLSSVHWRPFAALAFIIQGCATSGGRSRNRQDDTGDLAVAASSGSGGAGSATSATVSQASTGATGSALGFDAGTPAEGACAVASEQEADATCKVAVNVESFVLSSASCWVDSPLVAGDAGELSFACGDGPAELVFPSYTFAGQSDACTLDLTLTTQFPFSDGCTWQSEQSIVGAMEGTLVYSYSEYPIAGTGCASPCTVDAELSLELSGPVEVEPPS